MGRPAREPRELLALYDALEAKPADAVTRRALADWYEEAGEARAAACLRWLAETKRAPYRYSRRARKLRHKHESWRDGWYWWATANEQPGWGYPESATLPHAQWKALAHTFNYDPVAFKEYETVRGAVEALVAAWDAALVGAAGGEEAVPVAAEAKPKRAPRKSASPAAPSPRQKGRAVKAAKPAARKRRST